MRRREAVTLTLDTKLGRVFFPASRFFQCPQHRFESSSTAGATAVEMNEETMDEEGTLPCLRSQHANCWQREVSSGILRLLA